jgi:hypothetical protein
MDMMQEVGYIEIRVCKVLKRHAHSGRDIASIRAGDDLYRSGTTSRRDVLSSVAAGHSALHELAS